MKAKSNLMKDSFSYVSLSLYPEHGLKTHSIFNSPHLNVEVFKDSVQYKLP